VVAQGTPRPVTQEGALFLLLPVGAQAIGVARAMTALPSAQGAFWNPASLATVTQNTVLFYHGNHLTGNATGLSGLFSSDGTGTLGVGLRYERFEFGIARSLARGRPALQQDPVHLTPGVAF